MEGTWQSTWYLVSVQWIGPVFVIQMAVVSLSLMIMD